MPYTLFRFVSPNKLDHVALPGHRTRVAFVADLVEHIVEITYRIDNSGNVLLLKLFNACIRCTVNFPTLTVSVLVAINAVNVVLEIEGMATPRVLQMLPLLLDAEPIEQHNCDVNSTIPSGLDTLAKSRKIMWIKFFEVELQTSIQCGSRSGPAKSSGRYPPIIRAPRSPICLFPRV